MYRSYVDKEWEWQLKLSSAGVSDDEESPPETVVAAPATAPPAFQVEGKSIVEIFAKIACRTKEHERDPNLSFSKFLLTATDQGLAIKRRQNSFLGEIQVRLAEVEQSNRHSIESLDKHIGWRGRPVS